MTDIPSNVCSNGTPLIALGSDSANAPKLNYNLPQDTSFDAYVKINFDIDGAAIKPAYNTVPQNNYWDRLDNVGTANANDIAKVVATQYAGEISADGVTPSGNNINPKFRPLVPISDAFNNLPTEAVGGITESPDVLINGASVNKIVEEAMAGYLVYETRDFYGNKVMRRRKKPANIKPKLNVILHLKVCSFLGDYGAGKTIKTTSLLPGEKTRISIKSYKQSSISKKTYESVLDSFSEESSNEFEDLLEAETGLSETEGKETTKTAFLNLGANATVPVQGIPVSLAGGFGSTISNTTSASLTKSINALNSSLSKQAQRASASRNMEVNTEQEVTETSGEEKEIIREFENINYSRVLNFVFRQLMQEYITITYLDDISIEYDTGYPEHYRVSRLNDLDEFINDIFATPTEATAIKNAILNDLVSIEDYQGNQFFNTNDRFIEKYDQTIYDFENPLNTATKTYYRMKPGFSQSAEGFTLPGLILDVSKRIMKTDSVVVDALLGQGEALDCYNIKLQNEAVVKARLENELLTQQKEIIDTQSTAADKADKYKKVFGDCCDTPQTQIIP